MKKVLIGLIFCLFLISSAIAEELTPGQIGYLTHEAWYEEDVGYGWVTYPNSPLNDDLPYNYVYVETENDPLPEGLIHTQGSDGLIGIFSMSWRPEPLMPDEDIPNYTTKELLDLFLETSPMKCLDLFSIDSYGSQIGSILESHIEGLHWEYNVFDALLERPDLTETLFSKYTFGCNADAIELFLIADQLEHGEYAFHQKMELEIKKDAIRMAELLNLLVGNVDGCRLFTGIYNSYVLATGKLDCSAPFRIMQSCLIEAIFYVLWCYLLMELSKCMTPHRLIKY